jgi:hypothetical protein
MLLLLALLHNLYAADSNVRPPHPATRFQSWLTMFSMWLNFIRKQSRQRRQGRCSHRDPAAPSPP